MIIAAWPGGEARIEKIVFWSVAAVVHLEGGETFPMMLPPADLRLFHHNYHAGKVERIDFSVCPLLPPPEDVVVH